MQSDINASEQKKNKQERIIAEYLFPLPPIIC